MSNEIRLPALAESMTEATLVSWLKREGDRVEAGEPIAELETEKSTVDLEAPVSGTLDRILVAEGTEGVEVGQVLAVVASADAAERERDDHPTTVPAGQGAAVADAPTVEDGAGGSMPSAGGSRGRVAERPEIRAAPAVSLDATQVSPLAGRMAALAGLDPTMVQGSGPGGRVLKVDIERVLGREGTPRSGPAGPAEQAETAGAPVEEPIGGEVRSHSRVRRIIAARLTRAKQTIPHFYLRVECAVDELLGLRAALNASGRAAGEAVTVNDLLVRAAALALHRVPAANVSWTESAMRVHADVDVAIAVATPDGLVTPVVRRAAVKDLHALSSEIRDLTARARAGRLAPAEYAGGVLTVSNLGMHGVESLYGIIHPPQSALLGIGATAARPVVRDGGLAVGTVMVCTLSADHRAYGGVTGAALLGEIKRLVETPRLLLDVGP